ncbi:DsbA family protein [Nocardia thailandica]
MSTGRNPLAEAEAADRKRQRLIQVAVAGVLIALVAAIGIGIAVKRSGSDNDSTAGPGTQGAPVSGQVTESGAVRVGNPDAKVKIRVVADLQCPACKAFEAANGQALEDAVADGTAVVEYQIISFLDRASTNQYSSRAANASFCLAETGVTHYQDWLQSMFAQQPAEGGAGHDNAKLIQIAADAGYTDPAIADCVNSKKYDQYIKDTTQATLNSGVQSTPTVTVNGTQVTDALFTQNGLASVIADAAK